VSKDDFSSNRGSQVALRRLPATPTPMHLWSSPNGLGIAADSWGPQSGQAVLLLHGGGQTRHAWKHAGYALGALHYRVIAFDARGHGDSDWDPLGDYSSDARVRDLRDVVKAAHVSNPVLVGASMGGVTSLIAIGEGQLRAAALVLVDIAPAVDSDGVDRIRNFMKQRPEGFESLQEVSEVISAYQPHRRPPDSLEGLAKNVRIADNGRYYWHWDPRTRLEEAPPDQRRSRMERCAHSLAGMDLPVLLIRGGLSDVLSEEGAREFLALCPRSEYVNVAGAAHMVPGDRNDIFTDAIARFLIRNL
jgi:pimeloyl-ACP methyl ester carboxylesterase